MKTINSLSGGKTSSYIAANYPADYNVFSLVRTEDEGSKFKDDKIRKLVEDRIQAPFIATAEDDTIIYTMLDLEQYIGKEINWVTGPTFEKVIGNHGGFLPNKIARYCTTDMKTMPIAQWRHKNIEGDAEMRFGFRANEQSRAKTMTEKLNERGMTEVKIVVGRTKTGTRNRWGVIDYCKPSFPLIEDAIFKDTIEEFWKDKPVRFSYMNNCVGCWWRAPMLLKHMADRHPEKMDWFARQEEGNKGNFRSDVSYREIISYNSQFNLFDEDFTECDGGYCGL
jgi:hypothetical protein|tara:strand:+ start:144 stop:986 length:843 start_codon:yes stop_codon:yes gene_type:complete